MKFKHVFSLIIFNLFFGLILATNYSVFNHNIEKINSSAANSVATLALTGEISVDSEEACLNQTTEPSITFTGSDSNDNFPYTFEYTINGGDVYTIQTSGSSPSESIAAPTSEVGEFTYALISITDSSNEIVTLDSEITITINPLPEVSFEIASGDGACSGTPVVFNSTVSGDGPFSYAWNFGDNNTSSLPNPVHTYNDIGCGVITRTAILTVTDGNGCSSSASQVVNILKKPELEFFDVGATGPFDTPFKNCNPGSYLLTVGNISPDLDCIDSYDVAWGDGTIETGITASDFPIDHTYTTSGVFNLTFTALGDNGCVATEVIEVANSTNPEGGVINPGNTENLCAPAVELEFRISGWHDNPLDTQYIIDYGDGLAPEIFSQEELVASIYFDPPLDFPIPHTYIETNCPNTPFEINFEFVTACGTTSGTIGPISLVSPPDVSFEVPEIVCVNTPVEFINTSENGFAEDCSEFAQWFWNFGDGTPIIDVFTDTPQNITHVFTTPGIYTVSLTAFNPGWSVCPPEPFTFEVCVEAPLEPLFSVTETEGCGPLTIEVSNNTDESNSCEEVDYLWTVTYEEGYCGNTSIYSFVNDTDETSSNPQLLFEGPGIYTLTLSATNSCGTENTAQIINVKAPPTITLDPIDNVCAPAEITPTYVFDLCDADNQQFNWIITGGTSPTDWEFIDGSNASSPNPTINFITPNTYTITVELTNECGTESSSQEFTLQPVPEITNTDLIQTICSGVQVDEIVFESTEPGTTFSWITTATANIDGEVPSGSGGFIPAHALTLNNDTSGCVTYSVTPSLGDCEGTTVDFVICVEPSPTFTLQPVGDAVCIDGVTPPLTVAYQDGTGTPTYEWFRVDTPDDVSVGTDPTFEPPTDQAGVFSYYVVISFPGNGGCSAITSEIVDITVVAPIETTNTPSVQDICVGGTPEELIVTNTTGAGNVTYEWFSNTANTNTGGTPIPGANSATYTPSGPFDTVGIFYYYVVISDDAAGCFDIPSGVYTINVVADPTVTIDPAGPLEYCQFADADPLTAIPDGGVGIIYTYEWFRVENPNDISVGTDPTFEPPTDVVGVFSYYVVITQTASGCSNVSIPVEVTITEGPSITTQPVGDAVCIDGVTPPLTVAYQDGTGTPTYEWFRVDTPDDVSVGTDPTFEPPTDQAGVFSYYVVISFPGNGGCSAITSEIVDITVVAPIETTNTPSVQDICVGGTPEELIVTNTTGAGNVTYEWFSNTANTNTGGTPIPGANSATYTPSGPFDTVGIFYYYVVISDDAAGCFDIPSGVYTINVVADPTVTIDPAGPLEYCQFADADPLTAIPDGGVGIIYTYEWFRVENPNDISVGTDPTFEPPTDVVGVFSYYVVITQTASGCSNVSIPVEVTITEGPSITTQPVGDAVCIDGVTPPLTVAYQDGTGTPTYEWFRVDTPNDVSVGTDPTFEPPTDQAGVFSYYVVISFPGNGGCSAITSEIVDITVVAPIETTNTPSVQDICVGGTPEELIVTNTTGAGNVTYEWFSNTANTNTGGTPIPGANSATYTPSGPFDTVGIFYYYVVISDDAAGCFDIPSGVYTINVVADPTVTIDPAGPLEYCQFADADPLTAIPDGGVGIIYTYEWFRVENPNDISVGTDPTFEPPTDVVGVFSYYVVITQTASGCSNVSIPVEVTITEGPSITTQPVGDAVCIDGVTPPLTVAYQDGTGTPTYEWFRVDTPNDVSVGTDPTFEPPTDQAGVFSYYVVISFPGNGGCSAITSEIVDITVVAPIETTNTPSVQDICVGGTPEELIVTNTTGAGNVTYEWFSNTANTNTGGTPIPGANSATYTPSGPFDTVGIFYYYVVISDDAAGCFDIPSGVYTINVVADPTVTIDPAGPLEYCQFADADPLTAIPDGGVGIIYTYEWFRVENPNDISVGTDPTFEPPTDVVGVFSYYVVITQTASGCSNVSIPVEVTITEGPSITTQPVGDAVCIDGVTPPLTVAYQDGTGTPTYEWFRVDTPDDVSVGTDPTFEPPTDQAGVFSYYVVISFPGNGGCSAITSEIVDITVVAPIETTNTPSVQDICVGGTPEELIVTNTTGAGNVTYEWFSNTANTNTGGTPIPGANSATYTPSGPFDTVGIFYYYVVISDDAAGCFDIPSGVYTINVVADPTVTIDPAGPLEYCQFADADPLTAIPDGGVGIIYTYEWFRVENPNDISVGTDPTFEPPTDVVGVFSYYVVITQTASGCSNVSIPVEVTITEGPSITTQPVGDAVCIDGVTPPLTVAYQDGTGTPTYEWFRVDTPDDVSVGTDPTFEPPTDQAGVFSYYVVISFPGNGGCSAITSEIVDITVVAPIETTNTPSVQDICVGGTPEELIVTNTTGAGNVTYEWFSNTANTNTGGTPIPGANSATYTPSGPFDTVGIFYYYVVISDDAAGCFDIPSGVYTINVVADPTVTIDPAGPLEYCQFADADPLTAIPDGGVGIIYTYEWFRVENPNDISVGTDPTFEPPTDVVGVFSYYVVITQTASGCSNVSIPVEVTITEGPSITTQPVGDAVCIDGVTPPLTVAYQDGTGTPTYEWFRVDTPDDVSVGTDPTFEPPTDQAGVFSYYVVISFPGNGGCSAITSEIVDITVVAPIETTNTPSVQDICVGGTPEELIVTNTTGAGNVTYEWFSNTANTNTGGTPIPGANSATYTPSGPFDTVGIFYYYVVISDDAAGCFDIPSGVYTINVVADPTVTIDPAGPLEYCQFADADPLTAIPDGGVGIIYTYEWFRVENPNDISVGTDPTFEPPTDVVGVFSYYVVITQTASGCSNVSIPVEVTITEGPSITTQPVGDAVCIDGVTPPLTVAYQDGTGTPTYEWFRVDTPDDVSVGTDPTFEPPTDQAGVFSYYVVISFPGNGGCSAITSEIVDITVVAPIETTNTPSVQDICVGGTPEELIVTNTTGAGNVTYEWFSNTANTNTGGTPIPGANSATYTPSGPFDTVGIFYYYVVISDDAAGCFDIPSGVYTINVVADPTVTIDPAGPLEYCQFADADPLTAIPDGGVGIIYTYEWFRVENPNDISVGTDPTFEPPTDVVGVFSYYVVITQTASGCSNVSIPVEVTITEGPSITTQPVGDAVCIDGVTPPLTVAYQDGTGTPTYEWFRVDTPNDVSVGTDPTFEPPTDQAGVFSYYVVISFPGNGGCSAITSEIVDITVVAPIETTNTPSVQDICVGGTPEELIVTNTTGAGNVTYEWFSNTANTNTGGTPIPGANSATYTPSGPFDTVGIFYYYVVISDDAAGCFDIPSGVYTINVVADPTVTIDPAGPLEYCQFADADPLTAIPDGGVGIIYTYEWFRVENPNDISVGTDPTFEPPTDVVGVFSYYVVITQTASGCSNVSIPVEVTITEGPSITTQPVGDAVCIDGVTPPLTVAYQDGTGTPTYEWFRVDTPDDVSVGTDPTFEPPTDQAGVFSYYVVISFPGNGGCSAITSEIVDIVVYQTPILSDFTTTICSGETFSIEPDETNGDIVPLGTTYTWSAPVINPFGAILGAAGETTPQNNISQTLSNPISGVIATATYTVIPNSEICTGDPFTIEVTVNPQINVEAIVTNSACFEFDNAQIEITITGGVPFTTGDPFMIEWNGPDGYTSTDEDIFNLEPGTYTLEISDSEGCEFTDTYIITQPEELLLGSLDVFEDITCFGFDDGQIAVTIIGGTLDYIYEWEKDADGLVYSNDEDLANLPPGVYVLTVTDENGCVLVLDPLEIIEPELLTITLIEKVDIDCYGFNTGSIDIEANGGRPGYTYSWTGPAGFTSSDPDIFNLFPGTYTLVVTDTSGCTETLTEVIVQNDEITATINVTDVTCYGYNNGIIEIESIVGGVPFTTGDPYDILWSNLGSGLLQENLSPGIYTITITDALGCQRQYEIEVLEAPIFTLDPDVDQISCSGEDDGRIAINIVGGVAPLTVSWLDDPSAGIVRNNLPPGIYNVTVTDSSPIGPCVIEQEFVILPVAPLEISATVTDAFDCDDPNSGSINLSITGGTVSSTSSYSVTWSNGATTEDLINIGPGVYFVTVVDDNNCQITGQWEVNRFDPLDVTVTTETIADCDTRELYQVFTASTTGGIPDYTYLWSSGEVSGVNGEIMTATQNGTVTLTVTDSIGCIANYSFNVDLPEIGEVNFDQTSAGFINFGFYSILEPIQFINLTGGDYQVIIWDFGDGNFSNQENPTHTYTTPGTYTVTLTVTYPFGCTYTYTSDIIIEKGYKLVFPNAFTPNQDNLNDYFRPEYAGLNNIELRIFDTWGSQIYFESGDNISGWNGILKNKLAENGNYYYTFKAKTSYGEIILQDGPFTLIR